MSKIDLSVVRAFCAVYEMRSVTRAAEALDYTQPALSHAIKRLREMTSDPLFIRSATGMKPTTLAEHLYLDFKRGLELLEGSLKSAFGFNPATSERRFRISVTDIGEMVFIPALVAKMRTMAPHITIEACQVSPAETPVALATGQLDLAIGYIPDLRMQGALLFEERYVCLFGTAHPSIADELDAGQFNRLPHVSIVSAMNSHGIVWRDLEALGARPNVELQLSQFASLPSILETTNFLAAVPSRVASMFARWHALRYLPLPFPLPHFEVKLYWNRHYEKDPAHSWLRQTVLDALASL